MPARDDATIDTVVARFDRAADRYESWYETASGRRVAAAERCLLSLFWSPSGTDEGTLEVGCGTGFFTEWLCQQSGRVVGLDPSRRMLLELRRRGRSFPVVRGDARVLPFESAAFRTIFYITTLEFVDDPAAALREAVRVARHEVIVLWLNPWSIAGLRRAYASGSLLSQTRRLGRNRVRGILRRAAAERERQITWSSALFPWPFESVQCRLPGGNVLAMKLTLHPARNLGVTGWS